MLHLLFDKFQSDLHEDALPAFICCSISSESAQPNCRVCMDVLSPNSESHTHQSICIWIHELINMKNSEQRH